MLSSSIPAPLYPHCIFSNCDCIDVWYLDMCTSSQYSGDASQFSRCTDCIVKTVDERQCFKASVVWFGVFDDRSSTIKWTVRNVSHFQLRTPEMKFSNFVFVTLQDVQKIHFMWTTADKLLYKNSCRTMTMIYTAYREVYVKFWMLQILWSLSFEHWNLHLHLSLCKQIVAPIVG